MIYRAFSEINRNNHPYQIISRTVKYQSFVINIINLLGALMMTFQVRLKMARKPNQPRLRFDLEKLRNPDAACTFQATIGGKFAPLIGLSNEDMDMDTMITT